MLPTPTAGRRPATPTLRTARAVGRAVQRRLFLRHQAEPVVGPLPVHPRRQAQQQAQLGEIRPPELIPKPEPTPAVQPQGQRPRQQALVPVRHPPPPGQPPDRRPPPVVPVQLVHRPLAAVPLPVQPLQLPALEPAARPAVPVAQAPVRPLRQLLVVRLMPALVAQPAMQVVRVRQAAQPPTAVRPVAAHRQLLPTAMQAAVPPKVLVAQRVPPGARVAQARAVLAASATARWAVLAAAAAIST